MISTMEHQTIVSDLKARGFRITAIRKAIIFALNSSREPISVASLLSRLLRNDLSANKTTIYREIEFLKQLNIVREIEFGDGKKRYELATDKHHHHIVCVKCGKIEDFDFDVDLEEHEKLISKQTNFRILEHSIEFFGLCKKCQR
jgi:Fe2+ or Zn2+ uptake regulation protein